MLAFKKHHVRFSSRRNLCSTHGIFGVLVLFQFFEDFICAHPAGQQLFQHLFGLGFLCFFRSFLIGDSFLGFQPGQFFLDGLESRLLLFLIHFQSIDVGGDGSNF